MKLFQSRHSSPHGRPIPNGAGGGHGGGGAINHRGDTHMDSDAEDSFETPSRRDSRHRLSFRRDRLGRSRDLRGREHTPPRSRASSREDSFDRGSNGNNSAHANSQIHGNQVGQQVATGSIQGQNENQQNQVALAGPSGMVAMQTRSTNELLSLSSVSQQLQMQGLNHT